MDAYLGEGPCRKIVGSLKCGIPQSKAAWVNLIANHCKKPSEKPHKLTDRDAEVLTIEIVGEFRREHNSKAAGSNPAEHTTKTPPLRTRIVIEKIRPAWWPSSL